MVEPKALFEIVVQILLYLGIIGFGLVSAALIIFLTFAVIIGGVFGDLFHEWDGWEDGED